MKVDVRRPHTTRKERRALAHQAFMKKCKDEEFSYIFHWDQGGRHGGLTNGQHDWQEGCDNYYDNHTMKGHNSSCRAYNKVGMEYDI